MAKKKNAKNNTKNNTRNSTKQNNKEDNSKKNSKHAGAGKLRRSAKYRRSEGVLGTDLAASTPGIMMVAMLTIIFLAELLGRVDTMGQINLYRGAFRTFDYITIAVGIIFLIYEGTQGKLKIALKDFLDRSRAAKAGNAGKAGKAGSAGNAAQAGKPQNDAKAGSRPSITVNGWIEMFFGLFLLCVIISTCINGLDGAAAFGLPVRYIGIFNVFAFFIIYMKVSEYLQADLLRHVILVSYLILADLIALSTLWNQYIGEIPAYQNKAGISAIFANSNHFGYFICMAVMIGIGYFVYEEKKLAITGGVSAILNLIVLALNNTLGAQLAVGICVVGMTVVVVLFDRGNKKVLYKMLGTIAFFFLCVIGAIAVFSEVRASIMTFMADLGTILSGNATGSEGSGRMVIWKEGVEYVRQKPMFGHGCEGITLEMKEKLGIGDVHSEPLTYAIYYGIPAMLFYLAGVVMVAVRYFKGRGVLPVTCRIAFLGVCVYFLSAFVGVAMFTTAPFFFVFMGMAASAQGRDASNQS